MHFRVWAPASKNVAVVFEKTGRLHSLEPEGNGYFSGSIVEAGAGTLYKFQLDSGAFPDPASRYQPEGPHGPSQVIDPATYRWCDRDWRGVPREGQVLYEMHVGTFTPEGTWKAAGAQLPELARLGVTVIEMMPVADFAGKCNWGYDGVDMYAPTRVYGEPDDLRAFVDLAHQCGIGVILDVVYNHFGPDGNYFKEFSPDYFNDCHDCEWGDAINYDGPNSGPVRDFVVGNAGYWIDEFHMDGLRLDATQQIYDDSPDHVIRAIGRRVREAAAGRATYIVNENEPQLAMLVEPEEKGGFGLDSLWNDDFHHSAMVALTGRNEAYYTDYLGKPQEFISMAKYGYLYQGQRYKWQKKRRGTPSLRLHPSNFVSFIQNHDQIANTLSGKRVHELASPGTLRATTALMLLGPQTPMLFQGQEFAASSPFLFFSNPRPEFVKEVADGRRTFIAQFPGIGSLGESLREILDKPADEQTFLRCKLDLSEREKHAEVYRLHCDLLRLRREDPVLRNPRRGGIDGAVLGEGAFVLRYFGESEGDDRLLVVNFGCDLRLDPAPEPLLAPVAGSMWETRWTSDSPRYGGSGTPPMESEENWHIQGQAAALLVAAKETGQT